jgi:hypothetical protein
MANTDDGVRGEVGILISLRQLDESNVRLVVDRARRQGDRWVPTVFSTHRDIPKDVLLKMSMPEDDLNTLGLILIAELSGQLEALAEKK